MTEEDLGQLIHVGRGAAELPAFLAAGGDVNAIEPRSGMPLLHLACEHLNLDAIQALVAAGADLNLRDSFGQVPLHVAVDNDIDSVVQADGPELRFETTRLLLSLGADPNVRDSQGRTPRDWAAAYGTALNTYALDEFDRRTKRGPGR
jgi:ankyrin repeat protein